MSDIGLNFDVCDLAAVALFLCWPGIAIGLAAGSLLWRRHRIWGAVLGGPVCGVAWLAGWLVFADIL